MPTPARGQSPTPAGAPADARIIVQVHDVGDMEGRSGGWVGLAGSQQWIEGIAVLPEHGLQADDIEYCVVAANGEVSDWVRAGAFCGTRGRSTPLLGFGMRLRGAGGLHLTCSYQATFVDRSPIGPLSAGAMCTSVSGAALEALQITFQSTAAPTPSRDAGVEGEIAASNARFLRQAQAGHYDFLDLGTRDAGGFAVGHQLGGTCGLGFDIDLDAVRKNLDAGRDVICTDVTALDSMNLRARFAVCHHVLEHLPSLYDVGQVVRTLARCCSEFLFIAGPGFDHEDYLYRRGLKAVHSAMLDHTCRFKTFDLAMLLHELGPRHYAIGVSLPIQDSDSELIVRADAPNEVWRWEALRALLRPHVTFDPVPYRDIVLSSRWTGQSIRW